MQQKDVVRNDNNAKNRITTSEDSSIAPDLLLSIFLNNYLIKLNTKPWLTAKHVAYTNLLYNVPRWLSSELMQQIKHLRGEAYVMVTREGNVPGH